MTILLLYGYLRIDRVTSKNDNLSIKLM